MPGGSLQRAITNVTPSSSVSLQNDDIGLPLSLISSFLPWVESILSKILTLASWLCSASDAVVCLGAIICSLMQEVNYSSMGHNSGITGRKGSVLGSPWVCRILKGNNNRRAVSSFKLLFLSNWQLVLINF